MPCHVQKWEETSQEAKRPVGSADMEAFKASKAERVRFVDETGEEEAGEAAMASLGAEKTTHRRRGRRRKRRDVDPL